MGGQREPTKGVRRGRCWEAGGNQDRGQCTIAQELAQIETDCWQRAMKKHRKRTSLSFPNQRRGWKRRRKRGNGRSQAERQRTENIHRTLCQHLADAGCHCHSIASGCREPGDGRPPEQHHRRGQNGDSQECRHRLGRTTAFKQFASQNWIVEQPLIHLAPLPCWIDLFEGPEEAVLPAV